MDKQCFQIDSGTLLWFIQLFLCQIYMTEEEGFFKDSSNICDVRLGCAEMLLFLVAVTDTLFIVDCFAFKGWAIHLLCDCPLFTFCYTTLGCSYELYHQYRLVFIFNVREDRALSSQ